MELEQLLESLYSEPDLDKRRYIPDKLAKLGDWSSTQPLGELIVDDTQPDLMRNEAVESLGKQGDPKAVPYLVKVLTDPDDEIRRTAVWSLGQIGVKETLDPVFSMTNDPNVEVRRWVAKSAGRIRNDRVISKLRSYLESISYDDERVLADIIRAVSSQIERLPEQDIAYWVQQGYAILQAEVRNYVKQAVMILLNLLFERGTVPDSAVLLDLYRSLPENDPLVRPLIIEAMGYAGDIDFLREVDHPTAIKGLGIAGAVADLENLLARDLSDDELIAVLEAYTYTSQTPDLNPYYSHDSLTVRTQALQLHALRGYPIDKVHEAFQAGDGRYKIIEIYRYYREDAIRILGQTALESDKVARQHSVYSLISEEMLTDPNLHDCIRPILEQVATQDRIWHIRRDARIGLELIS